MGAKEPDAAVTWAPGPVSPPLQARPVRQSKALLGFTCSGAQPRGSRWVSAWGEFSLHSWP